MLEAGKSFPLWILEQEKRLLHLSSYMSYMTTVLKGLAVLGFKHVTTGISCTPTKQSSVNSFASRMSALVVKL